MYIYYMATGFERNNITHDRLPVAAARLKTARTIFFFYIHLNGVNDH